MTANQRSRQERALAIVQRRLEFWTEVIRSGETEVDGKTVDPEEKVLTAMAEEANLNKKGVK